MYKLRVVQSGNEYEYEPGKSLLEILLDHNLFIDNSCNGKGICGKCKIRIKSGDVGEVSPTELRFLKPKEVKDGVRLACLIYPRCDLEIELMQKERKYEVLSKGYVPKFSYDPDVSKRLIIIHKPKLEDQTSFENQIQEQIAGVEIPFSLLREFQFKEGSYTAVLYRERDGRQILMNLEQGDTTEELYGVAVDIGTTTVVTSLVDMKTGKELANASMINAQKHFGLDVLTRITYEMEHPKEGGQVLKEAIVTSINEMILDVCRQSGAAREYIYEVTVGANCTMMHMLLGIDARSIGKAPYAPVFVKAKNMKAEEIGLYVSKGARLYCLPSVSAYIGADIVAGVYVCGLHRVKENVLFIDIGTNGEIVFSDCGRLLSCSCAAGPALEGMNISSGMRAAEGAVEDVRITKNGVKLKVIGKTDPVGVCGSGILAGVKELIHAGLVRKDGAFIKPDKLDKSDYRCSMLEMDGKKRQFRMTEELKITQGDVRQVQLAKGAVLSGFYALLQKAGKKMKELDRVLVAGQFGAHLPVDSMIGTGILPEGIRDKIEYVGNSSKTGAYMALLSGKVKQEMEELANHIDYMELGAMEGYERLLAECLIFPEV